VGTVLAYLLLAGCGSESEVKAPPASPNEFRNTDCAWSPETNTRAFSRLVADGALKDAMDRAVSCSVHASHHLDLSLNMSWGNAGCVARVTLETELPSNVRDCLLRRFATATVPPFSGVSPSVQVRMTNERTWWDWL
jgi:hypothetical protein